MSDEATPDQAQCEPHPFGPVLVQVGESFGGFDLFLYLCSRTGKDQLVRCDHPECQSNPERRFSACRVVSVGIVKGQP